MDDRARWNQKYIAEFQSARVNLNLIQFAHHLKTGRVLDLAGGLGQNGAWLANLSDAYCVIDADTSDEALRRAPSNIARVAVDAGALPFRANSFDTILNVRFYDPRVIFFDWLAPGGTVFFETFTQADAKYRPDFNPAHRFNLAEIPRIFQALEILEQFETDDGKRVFVTIIARR